MRPTAILVATVLLLAACSILPLPPPVRIAPPDVDCIGIDDFEPDICERMFALVQGRFPVEVANASRILIVDTCPPRVLCDRAFMYDAAVALLSPDVNPEDMLVLHVFGHMGKPLDLEPWAGPLPEHVAALIQPGG